MKLHLGVKDIPYNDKEGTTTGEVAEILEAKYHIMEIFWQEHGQEVADDLTKAMEGALESVLMGAPLSAVVRAAGAGTSKTEARMKSFLTNREMESLGYPGVPTQAARDGVNHRRKHPYAKRNPRRASFIDTGLYQASMTAWVDDGETDNG